MPLGNRNRFDPTAGWMNTKGSVIIGITDGVVSGVRSAIGFGGRFLGAEVPTKHTFNLDKISLKIRDIRTDLKGVLRDMKEPSDFIDAFYDTTEKILDICVFPSEYRMGDNMQLREATAREELFEVDVEDLVSDYLAFLEKYKTLFSECTGISDDADELFNEEMLKRYAQEFEAGVSLFTLRQETLSFRFQSIQGENS